MNPIFVWSALVISAIIIQTTILVDFFVNGLKPDLLLIIVVLTSIILGKHHGVTIGFFSGLLEDLLSGTFFGLNTLVKMFIGFIFGSIEQQVFKEHKLLPLIAMSIATVLNYILSLLFLLLLGVNINVNIAKLYNLLLVLAYNVVIALFVHKLLYKLSLNLKKK